MKKLKLHLLIIATFLTFNLKGQDTIKVNYMPNSRLNATPSVKKALEACKNKGKVVLIFPKGRYDFWPQHCAERLYYESNTDVIPLRRCPILLENLKNIEVNCNGSDFIFHDKMQPFTVDKCENVTIKNVNIDWDIPLTAQAQVVAVGSDYIDIAINVLESPYIIENDKIVFVGEGWKSKMWEWGVMEFDKETKLIAQETGDASCLGDYRAYKATEIKYGLVRMNHKFTRKPAVGNYLVLRHSEREHAGTFIVDSKNVVIEHINMYHNGGLGVLAQYSENLTYKNVNSVPNTVKNRILSGHDDGFHYSNCKGQIIVDSCKFLALMDDPINVHGTSVQIIEKISDKKLVCKFMHNQSIGFTWAKSGDMVNFIENEAMNTFGSAIVESFLPKDSVVFEITFKNPIPQGTAVGDALENMTWTPNVHIKNSFFGSNRARGILISTPGKVLVENNLFESSGSAILIAGDANGWFESGAVKDVTIKNNIFNDPCMTSMYQFCEGIISIFPEIPKLDANKPFHRNIRIENNTFNPFDYPVLYAKSTEGVYFNNNILKRSNRFKPFHTRKQMLTFETCKKVEISGNKLEGDILGKNVKLIATPLSEVKLDKKQGIIIEK